MPKSPLSEISKELAHLAGDLRFGAPVHHVYNPLEYAWQPHARYLKLYGQGRREVLLVGMNPGPWGMVQTGVPFGDISMVRDWLKVEGPVARPPNEHAKRPVLGFQCKRSEVSGTRLWGWARDRYGTAERFFSRYYVHNYCPLAFLESGGRNFTPDKLSAAEQSPLFQVCDDALRAIVKSMRPRAVLGVGKFAANRVQVLFEHEVEIVGCLPHPSPANPAANRGWAKLCETALREAGIALG